MGKRNLPRLNCMHSGRAGPGGLVWNPETQKAPTMMRHLKKGDQASGHTAADFCNRIKTEWFADEMSWPRQGSEGEAMDKLFQGLCIDLARIRARGLPQEMIQMRLEARLVSFLCIHYYM